MSASSSVVNPFVFMKSLKNPLAVVVKERHPPLVNPNRQIIAQRGQRGPLLPLSCTVIVNSYRMFPMGQELF